MKAIYRLTRKQELGYRGFLHSVSLAGLREIAVCTWVANDNDQRRLWERPRHHRYLDYPK